MTVATRATLRGLLLQDPRITADSIWSAQSTYTQADPLAGTPDPQQDTALVLSASGTQTASTRIDIRTLEPGLYPDGSYCWRLSTASDWYGWETPITLSGWEAWVWTDGTTAVGERAAIDPHAITLADGTILCVAQVEWHTLIPLGSTYQVRCYRRDPSTGTVSSSMVREVASVTDGLHPCLCLLPSGRVLCYSWLEAAGQLYVSYSDDGGVSWSVATRHGLREPIDVSGAPGPGADGYDLGRIRAVYGRGQVLLLACLIAHDTSIVQDTCIQYCSIDDGTVFEQVGISADTIGFAWFDVVFDGQAFIVATMLATFCFPSIIRIPSADSDLSEWPDSEVCPTGFATTAYWGDPIGGPVTDSDLSLVLADDGTLYVLGRIVGETSECPVFASRDGGRSWVPCGHAPVGIVGVEEYGQWWTCGDSSTHPRNLAATWQHGRIVVMHNWAANPGNEDDSLGCAYLGGFSTLTMQNYIGTAGRWPDQVSWSLTWLPLDEPGDCGWTRVSAGGTDTLDSGGLALDSTGGTIYYTKTRGGTVAEGIQAEAYVIMISGGSDLANDVILRVRLGDGAASYQVTVRLSESSVTVVDDFGVAADIGTVITDTTSGVWIRVAVQGGVCSVWYRPFASSAGEERRDWILLVDGATCTDGGAGVGTNLIEWGHRSGSAAQSRWYSVLCVADQWAATTLASGQDNPSDLQGRIYSPLLCYVGEGVSIQAESGPTMSGDVAYISTAYGYGLERIFPELRPSPREGWRSTATAQATIALRLDPSFISDCGPGNDIIGLCLWGINFREVRLQGYSGAWTTLQTIYSDSGLSGLHFTRTGNTIQSDGTTAGPYIHFDEFAGCSFVFDDGTIRRIAHNTEGSLGTGAKRATLILDGVDDGVDDAAGTAGAVRSSWVVGLVKLAGADYSAYRLLIPAQSTVDGDFRIGTMLVGPVAVFGAEPSWGRRIETSPNREEREAADWTRRVRSRAPARRTLEIAWTDGTETTGAYDGDPEVVLDAAGGVAVASTRDTPWQVEGLVRSLAGPGSLVGYLPAIPYAGSTLTINRRWQAILGEVTGPVSVETVQGEEGSTEVVRVPSLAIREVV